MIKFFGNIIALNKFDGVVELESCENGFAYIINEVEYRTNPLTVIIIKIL